MTLTLLTAPTLAGVPHGFLGRTGGVSTGRYASLNIGLSTDDEPSAVHTNRNRAVAAVAPGCQLVTVSQVHGRVVVTAQAPWPGTTPQADALVTNRRGLMLGISTADCAPVLLADPVNGVIGAAHAGWKGALLDVLGAAVEAMLALGAQRECIAAAIGPCIGRASYEVDDAFQQRFEADDPSAERFFSAGVRPGHVQFDLEACVLARLAAAGVSRVHAAGVDTCRDADRFFSHRRATLAGDTREGRQISLIALPSNSI